MSEEAETSSGADDALPELDFATFVMSVLGSAYVHLGDAPDPEGGGAPEPNLVLVRQDIQLLSLLVDKTKGNLSGDEERVLNQGLTDLRMRLLEVEKDAASAGGA